MVLVSLQVKLYVANVGKVYYSSKDDGRKYYKCSTKKRYGSIQCNNKNITLKKIDDLISAENYRNDLIKANVVYAQELITLSYKLTQNLNTDSKNKVNELQKQLEEVKSRKNRILNMYELGHIEQDEFAQRIDPINKQIQELSKAIDHFSKSNEEIIEELQSIADTAYKFRMHYEIMTNQTLKQFKKEHTRDDIIKDIKQMIINEDGTVDIFYNTFEEYYKLREKHKELLDIYVKDGEVEEFIESMRVKSI